MENENYIGASTEDHNQLDDMGNYLRSLPEEKWTHFGEK